jgi:hypothetical protein
MNTYNRKFLAADLEVLRNKGFEYFKKSETWPVKEEEFHKFYDLVRGLYSRIINGVSDTIFYDIALVEITFVNQLINIFHYNYVCKYCNMKNIELIVGSRSNIYLNPEWQIMSEYYSNLVDSYDKKTGFIRNKAKNIVFNKHLPISDLIRGFFTNASIVGIGSNDRIKQEYIVNNKIFCDNRDGHEFIKNAVYLFSKNESNFKKDKVQNIFYKKIIKPFIVELKSSELMFVKEVDFDIIENVWSKRFIDAYKIYKGLLLINNPKSLLVTEVGKPYSKIITLAFQSKGSKVFNFHHGNDSALANQHWMYESLFGHCDNYVLDTEVMRKRFKELDSSSIKKINFISTNSGYYSTLRKSIRHNSCKNILLIGYPMGLARYPDDSYLFFNYRIKLEYTLSSMLKSCGYLLDYKAHPDRLKEIESVMSNVSNEIIEKPFEEVWQDADVLIFTYVPTTTFCFALNLPIPIVLIEIQGTPWYKNMRKSLEERVAIVKANITDGEISVDKNDLINAISISKNRVNLSVAEGITG